MRRRCRCEKHNQICQIAYRLRDLDFLYAESAERRSGMKTYTFNLRFRNGEKIKRTEWGRSRYDAVKTLMSIYGLLNKDFFICEEVVKA
jgi:hypothetical protein